MNINRAQVQAAVRRYEERTRQRERNRRLIREGRYLEIDAPLRVEQFLARRGLGSQAVSLMRESWNVPPAAFREAVAVLQAPSGLERILGTNDLMGIAFLEQGLQVARSVGRVWIGITNGRPAGFGTGFLVSPRLLLTNHHVLESAAVAGRSLVEFDYQLGLDGAALPTTTFSFDPGEFFFANEHLDYALVAVKPTGSNGQPLDVYSWNPLIEEQGKAIISQWLNIIQHPNGEMKQLAFRENQLIDLLDDFLHYETDTAPGSSGAPVFNDQWEVVGLHHSGVWATNAAGQILAREL